MSCRVTWLSDRLTCVAGFVLNFTSLIFQNTQQKYNRHLKLWLKIKNEDFSLTFNVISLWSHFLKLRKINDRCLRRLHEADPDPLPRFRGPAREQQRVCAVSVPRPFHRDGDSGSRFVARHFLRMLVFSFAVFDFGHSFTAVLWATSWLSE